MKWYWKLLIIISILILIWGIYENLTTLRDNDRLDHTIESIRTRNAELIRQLKDNRRRVTEMQTIISESERLCDELENKLSRSEIVIEQLRSRGKELEIGVENLESRNRELTEVIEWSAGDTEGIESESELIGRSIDRSLEVIGKLRKSYSADGSGTD